MAELLNPFSWFDTPFTGMDQFFCNQGFSSFCVFTPPTSPTFTAPPETLKYPYVVSQENIDKQMQDDWNAWKVQAITPPQTPASKDYTLLYLVGGATLFLLLRR